MDSKVTPLCRSWFSWLCSLVQSPLLLTVRLIWGYLFLQAGIGKFANMSGTIEMFQGLQIPYAVWAAYAVAFFEAAGGAFLILGLWSRMMALPLVVIMGVAFATAHQQEVLETAQAVDLNAFMKISPFTYLIASLTIMAFGPGVFSLDWITTVLSRKKEPKAKSSDADAN